MVLEIFDVDKQTNLPPLDRKILIKFGSEKFNWLIENIPNIYFLRTFSYPTLVNNTPVDFADDLKRVNKNFDYIDMRKYFSTNDLKKSFYLPWMGEKFNDRGMIEYAKAVNSLFTKKIININFD